jgi:hypothetical protein
MSRIAPDIPELQRVPDAMRSVVYMRALNAAIRSPLTWTLGAMLLVICLAAGVVVGTALIGGIGTLLGTIVGASISAWAFFTLILPWRTRRLIKTVSV